MTENKYEVLRAPSGWAVYDKATGTKVQGFSFTDQGRKDALAHMWKLNGWKLPKGGFR